MVIKDVFEYQASVTVRIMTSRKDLGNLGANADSGRGEFVGQLSWRCCQEERRGGLLRIWGECFLRTRQWPLSVWSTAIIVAIF